MMLTVGLAFSLSFCIIFSAGFPTPKELIKMQQVQENKLENQEKGNVTPEKDGKKSDEIKVANLAGSDSAVEQKTKEGDSSSKSDGLQLTTDMTGLLNQQHEYMKKCPDIVCAPPPSIADGSCQTSNDPSLNVMGPIMGPLSECCLLWICTRHDGSFFTHYGVASIRGTEMGSSGSSFANHYSHSNNFGQNHFPNNLAFTSNGNFGASNNFGGSEAFHGQGHPITTAALGFTGQFLNPGIPSFPNFQIQSPFPPQPVASTSTWGVFRNRRDSNPQQNQNSQFGQPRAIRQSGQDNFRRPMQFPQF